MDAPSPFEYPRLPHSREHGPTGYEDPTAYKPWLRDEFEFRCGYCLQRERWYRDGSALFSVEHVIPRALDPTNPVLHRYSNLLYACVGCNSRRREMIVLDPTDEAFGWHIVVGEDGALEPLTAEGRHLIETLVLNRPSHIRERLRVFRIIDLHTRYPNDPEVRTEFLHTFGYPDDLPDLARLQPPGGNMRPESVKSCHFARRTSGELPAVY